MEDEFELSLELSIGGCYGKPDHRKNIEAKTSEPSGSDFSSGEIELASKNGSEFVDLQRRKEIHALRRREARMKREVKKSKALNNVSLTLVEDKLILEGEQFQTRVRERENREVGEIPDDSARETEGASISGDNYASRQMQAQFLLPQVQYLPIRNDFAYPCVVPSWRPNSVEEERNAIRTVVDLNSPVDLSSGNGSREAASTRSVGRSSSVVSDHRSSLKKGGSSSETGSHSSIFGTHQNQCVSTSDNIEHLEADGSSSHIEPGQFVGQLNPDRTTNPGSSSIQQLKSSPSKVAETQSDSTTETSGGMMKPPKPPTNNQNGASGQQMPCVSTTGNGPNGKTITGFLYKYSKSEVCIVCLCHRTSFSPAGFVEHAGGVDISHPLKHITVVSSTL